MVSGIGGLLLGLYSLVLVAVAVLVIWVLVLLVIYLRLRIAELRSGDPSGPDGPS